MGFVWHRTAFKAIVLSWLLCGLLLLLLVATVRSDESRVQSRVREALSSSSSHSIAAIHLSSGSSYNDGPVMVGSISGSPVAVVSLLEKGGVDEGVLIEGPPASMVDVESNPLLKKSK